MPGTVADWIVKFLGRRGVQFVFSHPGGPVLPIYDSLRRAEFPVNVLVRHEGAASFMADAYAKVTGRVGVCLSTMGPGAANMAVGVGVAHSDSTPLIAITGQLATDRLGRGYQQETNHVALYTPITKWSVQLNQVENVGELFTRSYELAISGRPGPIHIDIPVDVSESMFSGSTKDEAPMMPRRAARASDVRAASKLITASSRPVMLVGGGTILSNASSEVRELAESQRIPVASSYNGRGALSENHPLALGRVGEYTPSYARRVLENADFLLAVGYRFTDVSLDGWTIPKDAKVVQIDIDPAELGRNMDIALGLLGDAKLTIRAITQELAKSGVAKSRTSWIREIKEARSLWRRSYVKVASSSALPIKPQRVIKEISRLLDSKNSIITAGAGRAKMWAASLLPIVKPRTWIHSGGFAPMGYEIPAAIACKAAKPEAQVVSVGGDGSFQMHAEELATAVEQHTPFVSVVLDDQSLASIKNAQLRKYGEAFGTDFGLDLDLAKVAKSFGAEGFRITKPSELAPSLADALRSDRPVVLDVKVDPLENPTLDY